MKRLSHLLAVFCLALPALAQAQNWTTVSASNITDLNQNKLATGQLCFLGTDQNDNPVSFNVGGGGQVLKRAFCSAVSGGAVTAFTVPNPANTQPAGVYYRVTVKDASTGQEVLRYTQVAFTGVTFSFDNYQPNLPGASLNPLTGNSVTGNLSVSGNANITGSLTVGSFNPTVLTSGQFTSNTANPAGAGILRLASPDAIDWRNNANSANIPLQKTGPALGGVPADTLDASGFGGLKAVTAISNSANPAQSGFERLASGDAVAWRNNANSTDMLLQKTGAASGGVPADTLDASGFGGLKLASPAISAETAVPPGVAGSDVIYADSTAHRWKMINNNGSANTVAGFSDNLGNFASGGAIAPGSVAVNGDTAFTASPRAVLHGFLAIDPGGVTGGAARVILEKPITITSVHISTIQAGASAGCSTPAAYGVFVNSPAVFSLAVPNGQLVADATGLSINVAAGQPISLGMTAAPVGCTTFPSDINIDVQYKMQ